MGGGVTTKIQQNIRNNQQQRTRRRVIEERQRQWTTNTKKHTKGIKNQKYSSTRNNIENNIPDTRHINKSIDEININYEER